MLGFTCSSSLLPNFLFFLSSLLPNFLFFLSFLSFFHQGTANFKRDSHEQPRLGPETTPGRARETIRNGRPRPGPRISLLYSKKRPGPRVSPILSYLVRGLARAFLFSHLILSLVVELSCRPLNLLTSIPERFIPSFAPKVNQKKKDPGGAITVHRNAKRRRGVPKETPVFPSSTRPNLPPLLLHRPRSSGGSSLPPCYTKHSCTPYYCSMVRHACLIPYR